MPITNLLRRSRNPAADMITKNTNSTDYQLTDICNYSSQSPPLSPKAATSTMKKPVLIPKSDWKMIEQMSLIDESRHQQSQNLERPKTAVGPRLFMANCNRRRQRTHTNIDNKEYYCRVCGNHMYISQRMKNNLNSMEADNSTIMCISCYQSMHIITNYGLTDDHEKLKSLGFNLNVKVTVMLRNLHNKQTRVIHCYLPGIFNRDDIDSYTLTISPLSPKALIFSNVSHNEKPIIIAVQPTTESDGCVSDWLTGAVMKSANTEIKNAEFTMHPDSIQVHGQTIHKTRRRTLNNRLPPLVHPPIPSTIDTINGKKSSALKLRVQNQYAINISPNPLPVVNHSLLFQIRENEE